MPKTLARSRLVALVLVAAAIGAVTVVLVSGGTSSARAAVAPGSTVRASVVSGTNAEAPTGGEEQELAAGGTAMAFTSDSKLDDLDTGGNLAVYVRDFARNRTVMISRGRFEIDEGPDVNVRSAPPLHLNGRAAQEEEGPDVPPNRDSYNPTISADGRYVAFTTNANNILADDPDKDVDLLICDRNPDGDDDFDETRGDGIRDYECFRVNEPDWQGGSTGDGDSDGGSDSSAQFRVDYPSKPKLSDDAHRIVWQDQIYDERYRDIVRTADLGPSVTPPGQVVDVRTPIGEDDPLDQLDPDVSGDGRFIVLQADFDLVTDHHAIMRMDTDTGAVLRVDWDLGTTPQEPVYLSEDESVVLAHPAISGDGDLIAFEAEEYFNPCTDGSCWRSVADQPTVYLVRVAEVDTSVVARDNDNNIVNGVRPALSGNGRFIAFVTDNFNVHDGTDDTGEVRSCLVRRGGSSRLTASPMVNLNSLPPTTEERGRRTSCQVVMRDLVVDRERLRAEQPRLPGTLASPGPDNRAGNGDTTPGPGSTPPSLSRDGSKIGYDSEATDLVRDEPDANANTDVFTRTFQPELRADPNPLEYGLVQVRDQFDRTVRFDHVGIGPLVVTDIAVTGSNPRDFVLGAQTCSGEAVVLQQTGNCEVSVGFAPSGAGDRQATLRLTLRDERVFTVDLRGTGSASTVPPRPDSPRFAAGPDPVAFGPRLLLSKGAEPTVTITNRGLSTLRLRGITVVSALAPNDYAVASNTCPATGVLPGAQCQITVRFSPTAPGDRPAVLRFDDNAPGGPHLIGLTGTGSTPAIEVSPAVTQPAHVVMVTGVGYAPDRAITVTLAGSVAKVVARTNNAGTFTASLLVLPNSPIGNRNVVATVDTFPSIFAEKPILVVVPTVSPADFVVRG